LQSFIKSRSSLLETKSNKSQQEVHNSTKLLELLESTRVKQKSTKERVEY
jgi:hypothetical protein